MSERAYKLSRKAFREVNTYSWLLVDGSTLKLHNAEPNIRLAIFNLFLTGCWFDLGGHLHVSY